MKRLLNFLLLLVVPVSLHANEIQHVLAGAFSFLLIFVLVTIGLNSLAMFVYLRKKNPVTGVFLVIIGGLNLYLGFNLSFFGILHVVIGGISLMLPIKHFLAEPPEENPDDNNSAQ